MCCLSFRCLGTSVLIHKREAELLVPQDADALGEPLFGKANAGLVDPDAIVQTAAQERRTSPCQIAIDPTGQIKP